MLRFLALRRSLVTHAAISKHSCSPEDLNLVVLSLQPRWGSVNSSPTRVYTVFNICSVPAKASRAHFARIRLEREIHPSCGHSLPGSAFSGAKNGPYSFIPHTILPCHFAQWLALIDMLKNARPLQRVFFSVDLNYPAFFEARTNRRIVSREAL
jgi:hypothetical protein